MAKKGTKAEGALIGLAVIVGLPIFAAVKLFESVGWITSTAVVIGGIGLCVWYLRAKKEKRLAYLREKYQDEDTVQKIFRGYFWQGQTEEQLIDSLGAPIAVDHKLLKTKTKDVWKYRQQGANRYALRINVEDGYVTGWDQKA